MGDLLDMKLPRMTEDDFYRSSTQYRLWSFSPEGLAEVRGNTHAYAIERARQYFGGDGAVTDGQAATAVAVDDFDETLCLTVEEELRLVQRYCDQIRTTNDHFGWPEKVKATAVQYLKRFYLSNSCMTYPPKEMYKTVLYLASKAEGMHMPVREFGRRIATDPESILAPEYKVMQGLRFTLDVRQPFRGLRGCMMELLSMAHGEIAIPEGMDQKSGEDAQREMLTLEAPPDGSFTEWKPSLSKEMTAENASDRTNAAYKSAKYLLDAPALLTDAYFHYTPSQILHAALYLSDRPLLQFYLGTKMAPTGPNTEQIVATIESCAAMLASFDPKAVMSKDERAALEKKLERCRDPNTRDLVAKNAEAKRGGVEEGMVDEEKAKKYKEEREKHVREGEDLFGPEIKKPD